ncbi:MAG: single-stranded DNA-binding protein [Spirochaetes bacterium GWB1_48_6]|nr:MAG: single-stranded DNA-binding protein [Spirochaetes bacterium GWB1_48_6]
MASDINQVVLIGRLTRDAELKYTAGGMAIGKMSIAVNRRTKKAEQWVDEASFFDVSLFGKQAESLNQYLVKGTQIAIQGELRQDRWEQDGQKRSSVNIAANDIQLLGRANQSGEKSSTVPSSAPRGSSGPQAPSSFGPGPDFEVGGGFDDDIPF